MFIAYIDESGNTGEIANGGTLSYTLGCITLNANDWPEANEAFLDFRRRLKQKYGIPIDAELKANYLLRGSGALRDLGLAPKERYVIYRAHLRMAAEMNMSAFAIFIDKRRRNLMGRDVFDLAWETLLQRLERKSHYEQSVFEIRHDDGEAQAVRQWARYARTHLTAGSRSGHTLDVAMKRLVEDPIPCDSKDCLFIQLADMVAFAAFRHMIPPGENAPGVVCPVDMWEELGSARNGAVNMYSGGPSGIVNRWSR